METDIPPCLLVLLLHGREVGFLEVLPARDAVSRAVAGVAGCEML